ncbi:MAG TPA: ABC transporter ATP-binding protein [Solirubrobacteraceae bacterium]|nr:ABC transporter ATP-binding protein [Solirubrobacteraceae bacterium]
MSARAPAVLLKDIRKRFGPVQALDGVTLSLERAQVHALLGENGAGKTTLMNVLCGLVRPDAGEIVLDGTPADIRSPRQAAGLGIGMVHQHFRLIDRMTVAENIHLGWTRTPGVAGHARLCDLATAEMERFGVSLDPTAFIADLSVAEQQLVEAVRTLARGTSVLILDEPTAVLTPQEAGRLFDMVRGVVATGTTVVFISHKLREVVEIAGRVTVMRKGRVVANVTAADSDERSLARLMIGRDLVRPPSRPPVVAGGVAVSVKAVSARNDRGLVCLHDVSLTLGKGEIVGVAGVAGNGQRELADVLTGLREVDAGTITVAGSDLTGAGPLAFIRAGVGYVAEDRNGVGLVPSEPIWCNAVLRSYRDRRFSGRPLGFRRRAARSTAQALCEEIDLSTREVDARTGQLSGGNAQRLLVGREVALARTALVAAHPTRGLDIAAADTVKRALVRAREAGLATLLISEELDELLEVSDRILVIYEGRIVGEFPADEVDEEHVGLLMGGGRTAAVS